MKRKDPLESFTGRKFKKFEKDSDVANTIKLASQVVDEIDEKLDEKENELKFETHKEIIDAVQAKVDDEKIKFGNKTNEFQQIDTFRKSEKDGIKWEKAKKFFPKRLFPWNVLPVAISESLQQLSRSCATSPTSLPGAAFAIFASVIGSTINIKPKDSWTEPVIIWSGDIRPSGSGKTPAARELCHILYEYQRQADRNYKIKLNEWKNLSRKERGKPPERARGYFVTDLTLEGLRMDVTEHGGIVCIMDELSSFLNSQNQYKHKGNDRECWLTLWDGKPARIVRANDTFTINGSRINIFGGIQPRVWQTFFGGTNGLFLEDGTIYRFLTICENDSFFPLTNESWNKDNRKIWEHTIINAIEWTNYIISEKNWKPISLVLNNEAQIYFIDWRNELFENIKILPDKLRGFLPKIVSYSLRLSGLLHAMERLSSGVHPENVLTVNELKKGIEVANFYMGHAIYAIETLCSSEYIFSSFEITEQAQCLAITLDSLKNKLDSGRIAIGFICEKFNENLKSNERKITPRAMGSMLRNYDLTIPQKPGRVHGKAGVKCLEWDQKTENFLKACKVSN